MKTSRFHIRTALSNISRNMGINLLTVFSIWVGLFLIAITAITVVTLNSAVREWTSGFGIVVYLDDGLSPMSVESVKARIERQDGVKDVSFVSRENAMESLRDVVGESILAGLDDNPLPDSLELSLENDNLNPENVRKLAGQLEAMDGVKDIQYGRKWVDSIAGTAREVTLFGSVLGIALTLGIIFILSNTIKIVFYRRAHEIEILKLLGATRWFIRSPFLVEGTLVGLTAGGLAAMASWASIKYVATSHGLSVNLPWPMHVSVGSIILFGGLLGFAGSLFSLGRIRL